MTEALFPAVSSSPTTRLFPEVVFKIVLVTPDIAEEWMGTNLRNRAQRERGFAAYGRDIANGNWLLNGDTIKFDWDGNLIDGQHRLLACLAAGEAFETLVVWGLDPRVQPTVDTGMVRSFRDLLRMEKDDPDATEEELARAEVLRRHAMTVAALTRRVHQWGLGERIYFSKGKFTGAELAQTLAQNPDIIDAAQHVDLIREKNRIHASTLALLFWLLRRANKDLAVEFVEKLTTGADLKYGNPILVLRARITKEREAGRNNLEPLTVWLTMYAWNAWMEGRILTKLQLSKGGMTQDNFPLLRQTPGQAFYDAHDLARLDKEPVEESDEE